MSKRLYFLADGTLRTVTAGRFRGDDEVAGKTITEQIVVRNDGQAGAVGAPVHMAPNNPEGPLVVHYDSAAGQAGISVVDDATGEEVFEITDAGVVQSERGVSTVSLEATDFVETVHLDVGGNITGAAFDTGIWVPDTSTEPVPTTNTIVTRNAATETVSVSNLRVGRRTVQPKSFNGNDLVNDPAGTLAGDGVSMGLYFEQGEFNDVLRAVPPTGNQDAGACLIAQSLDDKRIYRFGFDPEKDDDDDGLHFTDTRGYPNFTRHIQLTLGASDGLTAMGTFENEHCKVEIAKGGTALECQGGPIKAEQIECDIIQPATDGGSLRFKNADGTSHMTIENDGTLFLQNPADDATVLQMDATSTTLNTGLSLGGTLGMNNHNISAAQNIFGSHVQAEGGYYSASLEKNICFSVIRNGSRRWWVDNRGHMKGEELHVGSTAVKDKSIYVGSSRFSFDRVNHVVTLHRIKKDHVPTYLSGRGVTTGDLSGINDMTVIDWVEFARDHFGEDDQTIEQVFPASNTGDWVQIDAPVPSLQAWADGADQDIATLENEMDAAEVRIDALEQGGVNFPATATVYVDAGFSGTSDGSLLKPYTSLKTAMETKLAEGATTFVTFKVAPGSYTGAISIDRSTAEQSFTVEGSGPDCTFVQAGTTFAAGASSNVLYLRDFLNVTFKNVCIRHGAYGLYPRSCTSCTVQNVRFVHLGSDGTANRHDLTGSQAEQAAFWASSSTSNGGACRIRSCEQVHVTNCVVDHCARGLRIQDCGQLSTASIVSGNRICRTLESGVYLAAGSYSNSDGCVNFKVCNNNVSQCFNNGILLIGGSTCSVLANTIQGCASSGIMQWSGLDNVIIGNSVVNCCRLQHNGVGNLGDAWANIHIAGSSNIRAGGAYIALVHNNTIYDCNQGRAAAVYGIRFGTDSDGLSYPSESAKASVDGNHTDAAVRLLNEHNVVLEGTAMDTRVQTLEADMTQAQTDIAAKQSQLSTTQLAVCNKGLGTVASNSGSNLVTADEIKSYVDANAGGASSGTSYTCFPQTGDATQLADDVEFVHVGKTANANQGGGLFKFVLPEFSSNPPSTHTFWIFSYNPIGESGGTIQLEHVSGHDFNNSADDQDAIDFHGDKCLLTRPGRNVYAITYYHTTQKWYVRRIGLDSSEQETHFTKHFANDESSYPQGSPYQCPSGKMRIDLIYGNGDDFSDVSQGVHFYLPVAPRDGCLVCAESTQNKTTSTPAHTLNMRWKQIGGLPTTRKLNYVSGTTFTSITPPTTTYGTAQAVQCYGGKTRREFWRYSQSGDFWVHSRDSN